MSNKYSFFIFLAIIILQCSSCFCNRIDCPDQISLITFNVFKNNENAIFGANSIYDKTQIEVTSDNEFVFMDFEIDTINENLKLTLFGGVHYFLKLDSLTIDTLVADFKVIEKHRCCSEFGIKELRYNGEAACVEDCEGVIRVEL